MIRDIFVEEMVRRRMRGKHFLQYVGILVGTFILLLLLFFFAGAIFKQDGLYVFFVCAAGLIALDYWLISFFHLEFEYSITNGDITVDKIINRRKRKHLLTFSAKDIDVIKRYKEQEYKQRKFDHVIHAEANDGRELWCIEVLHKSLGKTLVVFSPSERILMAIKPFMKRSVSAEAFPRYKVD